MMAMRATPLTTAPAMMLTLLGDRELDWAERVGAGLLVGVLAPLLGLTVGRLSSYLEEHESFESNLESRVLHVGSIIEQDDRVSRC